MSTLSETLESRGQLITFFIDDDRTLRLQRMGSEVHAEMLRRGVLIVEGRIGFGSDEIRYMDYSWPEDIRTVTRRNIYSFAREFDECGELIMQAVSAYVFGIPESRRRLNFMFMPPHQESGPTNDMLPLPQENTESHTHEPMDCDFQYSSLFKFESLNPDTILQIVAYLPTRDAHMLSMVSNKCRGIFDTACFWKKRILKDFGSVSILTNGEDVHSKDILKASYFSLNEFA